MRSRMSFIRRCATRKPENSRWPTLAQERTADNSSLPLRRRRTSMTAIPSLARSSRDRTWPTRSPTCRAIRATVRARPWSSKRSKSNAWPDGAQGDAHSRPPFPPDHGDDFSSPRRSARLAGIIGPIVFRPALARLGDCERCAHPVGATRALQSRRVAGALAKLDKGTFARACRCDDGGDCARAVSVGWTPARLRGPVAYGARNPRLVSFLPAALNAFLSLRRHSWRFSEADRELPRRVSVGLAAVALALIGFEVFAQARNNLVFVALSRLFPDFFQRKVHHIVVMELFRRKNFAEVQPKLVEQIHFVGREVGRMWPKDFVDLVPIGQVDFQIELRLRIAELFPGLTNVPRLFFAAPFGRVAENNRARFERLSGTKNTFPQIVGRNDRETYRLAALFRYRQRLRKKLLFDAAKELLAFEIVFARRRAPQQAHMKNDDIATPGLDAVEHVPQVVQLVNVADRNEDIARAHVEGSRCQFTFLFEIELIHGLHVACTGRTAGGTLREREHKEEQDGEHHSRNRSGRLGEQVHDSDREQDQRDQAEANGDFDSADSEVERHLILTLARLLVAQHEDRKAIHRETPDHAEGIEVREKRHVAAADQNRQDL